MDRRGRIEQIVAACGGIADHATLTRHVGRHAIRWACLHGVLERRGRGLYAMTDTRASDARLAVENGGILSGLSAARYWGWAVLREPRRVDLVVRHHRPVTSTRRVTLRHSRLNSDDIAEGVVTTPVRTVLDCAVTLPLDEALAVADSALRSGRVEPEELLDAAARSRGPGAVTRRRVAVAATPQAANPFESALRVRCMEAGLDVRPQTEIEVSGVTYWHSYHVDLADDRRRLVVEADSFAFHASPEAFARDCIRYTELVAAGWTVLRMPYTAVVDDAPWCREVLGGFSG